MKTKALAGEYAEYYERYTSLVPEQDVIAGLAAQADALRTKLGSLPPSAGAFRYADGKWTIAQVIRHLCDGERVFAYRALSFARGASEPLPSFEENDWAAAAGEDLVLADLLEEFAALRKANVLFFAQLSDEAWLRRGVASDNPVTVRALATIMLGHVRHHLRVVEERYLSKL